MWNVTDICHHKEVVKKSFSFQLKKLMLLCEEATELTMLLAAAQTNFLRLHTHRENNIFVTVLTLNWWKRIWAGGEGEDRKEASSKTFAVWC